MRRIRPYLTPGKLLAGGLALLALAAAVLWLWPSDDYLLLPDKAKPVAPLVSVKGREVKPDDDGGGIYYVAAVLRKAKLFEQLFPGTEDGATLVPGRQINGDLPEQQRRQLDLSAMARSQDVAAAVALRQLGYRVKERNVGVVVDAVADHVPASGELRPGDVIVSIDGKPVRALTDVRTLLGAHRPGDTVAIGVRRGEDLATLRLKTVADPKDARRAVVGI